MSSSGQAPGRKPRQNPKQREPHRGLPASGSPSGPETSSTNKAEEEEKAHQELKRSEVKRILDCEEGQYYQYLGVEDPCTKTEIQEAYKRLALLVHPDKNKSQGAVDAFQRITTAAKSLDVAGEEFADNAYGAEDSTDSDKEDSTAGDMAYEIEKPDEFRLEIYAQATSSLANLVISPTDDKEKAKLKELNKLIKAQNVKEGKPPRDFLIMVDTYVSHFLLAAPYFTAVNKDPTDQKARSKIDETNKVLEGLNQRHGYPTDWVINIPPDPNAGSSGAANGGANVESSAAATGGVKTKVGVTISDESDGRTFLGEVIYVRKAGFGSRVIVNRGTEQNPYYEVYPGAEFGKGVAQDWIEEGTYESEDLPKNTVAKTMTIYGRAIVKRTNRGRWNKTSRTQSEIQYYLITVGDRNYLSTRSALVGIKGMSRTKLDKIDAKLTRQNEELLGELDNCRENNEHPDTGQQLTSEDIENMPWLSPDAIPDLKKNEDDNDDDEEPENMVPHRSGLKRNVASKPTSGTTNVNRLPTPDNISL